MEVNLQTADELGSVSTQTDEQRVINAVALLATSRDPLLTLFGRYLRSSAALEAWVAAGAPLDVESVTPILKDVETSISALTALGSAALGIAGVSRRAVGMTPDLAAVN